MVFKECALSMSQCPVSISVSVDVSTEFKWCVSRWQRQTRVLQPSRQGTKERPANWPRSPRAAQIHPPISHWTIMNNIYPYLPTKKWLQLNSTSSAESLSRALRDSTWSWPLVHLSGFYFQSLKQRHFFGTRPKEMESLCPPHRGRVAHLTAQS